MSSIKTYEYPPTFIPTRETGRSVLADYTRILRVLLASSLEADRGGLGRGCS